MADNKGYEHEHEHIHMYPDLKNEDNIINEDGNNQHNVEIDHKPHNLFIEMDELILSPTSGCFEWVEQSRWIKYEETREEGSERWGKHIYSF